MSSLFPLSMLITRSFVPDGATRVWISTRGLLLIGSTISTCVVKPVPPKVAVVKSIALLLAKPRTNNILLPGGVSTSCRVILEVVVSTPAPALALFTRARSAATNQGTTDTKSTIPTIKAVFLNNLHLRSKY